VDNHSIFFVFDYLPFCKVSFIHDIPVFLVLYRGVSFAAQVYDWCILGWR
jgi:hypothetical protein